MPPFGEERGMDETQRRVDEIRKDEFIRLRRNERFHTPGLPYLD